MLLTKPLLAAGLFWTATATQSVFPSNSTSWNPGTDKLSTLLLETDSGNHFFYLQPLNQASYEVIPHEATDANGLSGDLYLQSPSTEDTWTESSIALIQCDEFAYPGQMSAVDVANAAISPVNVSAIIFYSVAAPFCNATGFNFSRLYSTTVMQNSTYLSTPMNINSGANSQGVIFTEQAFLNALAENDGPNSPTTAVAMIILYSITGVITALFLLIIITGAVRAHRHPERYGPRNVLGGTRQSRARGIARAMLDTIPIVKFGDNANENIKDPDLELNSAPNTESQLRAITTQHGQSLATPNGQEKEAATSHVVMESSRSTLGDGVSESSAGTALSRQHGSTQVGAGDEALQSASHGDTVTNGSGNPDEGLGCSICTDDFERGQDIRVLPCNHKFHPACVDPWLLDVSGTCPLCRIDLRPNADNDHRNGNESELPPPLDANHNEARRMSTLRTLFMFNRGSLSNASAEERIAALRRFRELNRRGRRGTTDTAAEESNGEVSGEESSNRLSRFWKNRRSTIDASVPATVEESTNAAAEQPPLPEGDSQPQRRLFRDRLSAVEPSSSHLETIDPSGESRTNTSPHR